MREGVILLEKGGLAVEVSPLGGAILSARWHDIPLLVPTPSPGLASQILGAEACFPLVPFGNRIESNGFSFDGRDFTLLPNTTDPLVLHGDGWLQRWAILHSGPDNIVFQYRHEASPASPFAYEATQAITVDHDSLTLSLSVTNRAAETLPYGLGFHPYFPRTASTRIYAQVNRYWSEREKHLPGAAGPMPPDLNFPAGTTLPGRWLNNAFDGWDGQARIEWPENGLALSLEASEGFGCFVVYAPSAKDGFFCFEPMTHPPNAHRQQEGAGLVALAQGEQLSGQLILRCQTIDTLQP